MHVREIKEESQEEYDEQIPENLDYSQKQRDDF